MYLQLFTLNPGAQARYLRGNDGAQVDAGVAPGRVVVVWVDVGQGAVARREAVAEATPARAVVVVVDHVAHVVRVRHVTAVTETHL